MAYANGKYAKFISDRSGMEYPYKEMVKEWNGSRVHKSEFEPKTPQDNPKRHTSDAESLQFPRPARTESAVAALLPRILLGLQLVVQQCQSLNQIMEDLVVIL